MKVIYCFIIILSLVCFQSCTSKYMRQYHLVLQMDTTNPSLSEMDDDAIILKKRLKNIKARNCEFKLDNAKHKIDIQLSISFKDTAELKSLVQLRGKFEIYETYRIKEILNDFNRADNILDSYNIKTNGNLSHTPLF